MGTHRTPRRVRRNGSVLRVVERSGEMRERLNRADSKSVVLFCSTEGSNPSLSDWERPRCGRFAVDSGSSVPRTTRPRHASWRDDREAEGVRLESVCTPQGYRGFESLSLRTAPSVLTGRPCAICIRPTPSGPEGSSGKRRVDVPQYACSELKGFFFYELRSNRQQTTSTDL